MARIGFVNNPDLAGIAALVRSLDVGGYSLPEPADFDAPQSGARIRLFDDDALLADTGALFDTLCARYRMGAPR